MPTTFTKIAAVTVGSGGASTIDFTSIPSTYTDLCLKISARNTSAVNNYDMVLRFNGDTGSNYNVRAIQGNGSSASSFSSGSQTYIANINIPGNNLNANNFGNTEIYVPNYGGSNQKSLSIDAATEDNSTDKGLLRLFAGLWTGTAAISSITLFQNFSQYSTATLYGISKS
jgi:hypothetical protein